MIKLLQKLKTGHEIFDLISNFHYGSFILILDEGHFDSILFLNALLSKFAQEKPVSVITFHDVLTDFNQIRLSPVKSLSDFSIFISQIREEIREGILIHHYLPHFLVQEDEGNILKIVEHWNTQIRGKPFLEFLTLPRGTFVTFEKKLKSLVGGFIDIAVVKEKGRYYRSFSIYRACKAEYHGVEFPYIIRDNKLLIKFKDEFTDKLPTSEETVEKIKSYLLSHLNDTKIFVVRADVGNISPVDYLLLSQIHNMHMLDIKVLFPERFNEILEKIARWVAKDVVELRKTEKIEEKPIKNPGANAKLILIFPNWLSKKFVRAPRYVPLETLLGLRKSIEVILNTYMPNLREPREAFESLERTFHEMAGRIAAIERIKSVGEDPRAKLDLKHLPRIVSLTLHLGFHLDSSTYIKGKDVWEIHIKDCFACEGVKSDKPVCYMISGTLTGALSATFKERIECEEIACKASGADECVFLVKKV